MPTRSKRPPKRPPKPKAPKKPPTPKPPPPDRRSPRWVPGVGPLPTTLLFLGEGPGVQEDRFQTPFVGRSGDLLGDMLEILGVRRGEVYITNVLKRHIPNNLDPKPHEIAEDRPHLLRELREGRPQVLITLGRFAAQAVGMDLPVEQIHGYPRQWVVDLNSPGEDYPGRKHHCVVIPWYHPAAGLHNTDLISAVYWDAERTRGYLEGQVPLHDPQPARTRVLTAQEALGQARRVRQGPGSYDVAVDTEGDARRPWGLTLAVGGYPGTAAVVRAEDGEGLGVAREIIMGARHVFIHNVMYDLDVLRAMGIGLDGYLRPGASPRVIDTMVLVWHQGVHPQGLKAVAWRVLGITMQAYGDVVGPVQRRMEREYLEVAECWGVGKGDWPEPEPRLKWAGGQASVATPWGMGRRLKAWRGALAKDPQTDLLKRWRDTPEDVRRVCEERVGRFPVASIFDAPREVAEHYATQDADVTMRLGPGLLEWEREDGLGVVCDLDHAALPLVARMQEVGMPASAPMLRMLGERMQEGQDEIQTLLGALGHRLNPKSHQQVARLLYGTLGLTPTKRTKAGAPSVSKKVLEPWRDTMLEVDLIVTAKEMGKIHDAFGPTLARWVTGAGRVHCTLRVTRAKTGRLASVDPNLLAVPVRTELGRQVRACFVAGAGRLLGTWDLSQVEMRVMAERSQDARLVEIYNRKAGEWAKHERDVHIMTAAKVFGVAGEAVTKVQRTLAKSAGFGIIMGITGRGLYDQMRLYRVDLGALGLDPDDAQACSQYCDRFIEDWLDLYPGVRRYQEHTREVARREGEVRDMWGRRFLLPGARSSDSLVREEAYRQSHALDIQASAQGIMKKIMARVEEEVLPMLRGYGYCEPLLQVHDEVVLEMAEGMEGMVDAVMREVMVGTVRLGSVPLEASGGVGRSWAELEK